MELQPFPHVLTDLHLKTELDGMQIIEVAGLAS